MKSPKTIGIVGGVGSYAGIDLIRKIYDLTGATTDQEHLPVTMISRPEKIADRTGYLLGEIDENPGVAIGEVIADLAAAGAEIIGVPCNTAHAPAIFSLARKRVPANCKILHLIKETGACLHDNFTSVRQVGLLATNGTVQANVYPPVLQKFGLSVIVPEESAQHAQVHRAIYNPQYGIKSQSNPVSSQAVADLKMAATGLIRRGAQAIILGCTEIPLALQEKQHDGVPLIDATAILAAALIRESRGTAPII